MIDNDQELRFTTKALEELLGSRLYVHVLGLYQDCSHEDMKNRIRVTSRVLDMLLEVEGLPVVKEWFIGLNPELDDTVGAGYVAPADAIRDGRFEDVVSAATAFRNG